MRLCTYHVQTTYAHRRVRKHTEAILHPETSDDEEEAPSGRSRFYTRSLCAVRPRMGNEGIGGMRSLDTEPSAGRGQAKYGAAG